MSAELLRATGPVRRRSTGASGEGPTTAEHEELRRLRRENHVLREEREVPRRAAVFFDKETDRIRS